MISIGQISTNALQALSSHIRPLSLPVYGSYAEAVEDGCELILLAEGESLGLVSVGLGEKAALQIDFVHGKLGHRRRYGGGRNQDLCRAVGLNRKPDLCVADATAGQGRDAFVMALNGATVSGQEKNPILASMLNWSLGCATTMATEVQDADLIAALERLSFSKADSAKHLTSQAFEVVYLDPMFPERDKSAKVKKEMQILHLLLSGDASSDEELFESCWSAAEARLVVKRPQKAPALAGRKPHHQILGKTIRYDVYVKKALS